MDRDGTQNVAPLRLADIAAAISLTTEQVAKMCGVSRRQIWYWVQRGIVPDQESHGLAAFEKILLVKRERAAGGNLRQVFRRVERQIAEREALVAEISGSPEPQSIEMLTARLDALERLLTRLQESAQHAGRTELSRLLFELDALDLNETLSDTLGQRALLLGRLGRALYLLQRLTSELFMPASIRA